MDCNDLLQNLKYFIYCVQCPLALRNKIQYSSSLYVEIIANTSTRQVQQLQIFFKVSGDIVYDLFMLSPLKT